MTEDSLAGIPAAKSAGLPCIAVGHSFIEAELYEAGADLVVADLVSIDEPSSSAACFKKLYGWTARAARLSTAARAQRRFFGKSFGCSR